MVSLILFQRNYQLVHPESYLFYYQIYYLLDQSKTKRFRKHNRCKLRVRAVPTQRPGVVAKVAVNPLRVTADTGNRKPVANDGGKDSTVPAKVGPAPPTTGLAATSNSADENNDASIIEQLAILDPDSVRSSTIAAPQ